MEPLVDVLVLGAGLAGLSCARSLADAGKSVLVVDRSTRLGGRCASKAIGPLASAVDFGPVFVHGDDPEFLAWLAEFGDHLVPGWPRVVEGRGSPCQPQAFDPHQRRFGLVSGLRTLAEGLASGLRVQTGALITTLGYDGDRVVARADDGREFVGRSLVVALALEQTRGLLASLAGGPGGEAVRRADALLGQFSSLPCLTVVAAYPSGTPAPSWDVAYPEASKALLLVANEASKRPLDRTVLTIQARPGWSQARLEADREVWATELLAEAAALVGPWGARPEAFLAHRWRHARLAPADHLVQPLVLEGGPRIGLVGELFDPDGGLQGAWRSGRRLAARWLAAPTTTG